MTITYSKYNGNVQTKLGASIPGALVHVYLTGTTTAAALKADDGVTALPNPLVTDFNGMFGFNADVAAKYDITVVAAGLSISITNITLPGGGGAGSVSSVNARTGAVVLVATDIPVMVASGASHAPGAVPDPGASAGTTKFLREDATWQTPPGAGGAVASVNTRIGAVVLGGTDIPAFVGSGGSHAPGAVPDPGASAGSTKFLREDATWATPAGGGGGGGGGVSAGQAYQAMVSALASLVNYWKFDEGVGSATAADSKGSTTLTIPAGLITGTKDLFDGYGNALINNGTAVGANNAAPTGLPVGNAARTVMCWARSSSGGGQNLIHYGTTGGSNVAFDLGLAGNTAGDAMLYLGSSGSVFCSAGYKLNDGRWHFIVATYDGAGNLKMYVDGQLTSTTGSLTLNTTLNGDGIQIAGGGSFSGPLTGSIDEVAICNTALSAAQILSLYKIASPVAGGQVDLNAAYDAAILVEASVVSYIPMDEVSGNFLDRKGSNHLVNSGGLLYQYPGPIPGANGASAWGGGASSSKANCASPAGMPLGYSHWTAECWYRYAASAAGDTYPIYFGNLSGVRQGVFLGICYAATANRITLSVGGDDIDLNSSIGLPFTSDNQWHQLVGTYDGTSIRLYWDGKIIATHALGGAMNISLDATGLGVGALTGSGNYIHGGVAKVAIYTAALSDAQVLAHYNTAKLGFAP